MMRQREGERGSITAELALALPAVLLVVIIGVGGLFAASTLVQLQDGAADAARLIARGESSARAASAVTTVVSSGHSAISHRGDLVCVTATATARIAGVELPLTATSCALAGGL
ncbi:TadE family type IV pilus minor pilin [Microbacterium sediminis]|nr:TadE family type IV pilus minor pilin [Microbacterium sediminis]QBR74687.1 hypothetical protein E3O41_09970 [Microbacterium sediminis]